MHQHLRSHRTRETIPAVKLGSLQVDRTSSPGLPDARSSLPLPQSNLGKEPGGAYTGKPSRGSLHRASFHRQVQELAESLPSHRLAPASPTRKTSVSEKAPPKHLALEEETRHKLATEHPPTQFRDMIFQLDGVTETLQKVVRKFAELVLGELPPTLRGELAANDCKQDNNNRDNNSSNTNNTTNTTTNTNNNNNDDNNYSNNKRCRESGLNSLDLDNDNPESEPDLDEHKLGQLQPSSGS